MVVLSRLNGIFGSSRLPKNWQMHISDISKRTCPNVQEKLHPRWYRSTARREILPLVGAAAMVLLVGRYSWRALRRMDEEWEEYEWRLKQYEKHKAMNPTDDDDDHWRVIAIDLGTIYTKLASSHPKPEVMVSREGHRFFFNGILYDSLQNPVLRGNAALERFHFGLATNSVVLPFLQGLSSENNNNNNLSHIIRHSVHPVLQESLDRLDFSTTRQVATLPVAWASQSVYRNAVKSALQEDDDHHQQIILLPDAVATVWGAQTMKLLPNNLPNSIHLIIDMGGLVTQFSLVQNDIVVQSISIPFGGETIVHVIEEHLRKEGSITTKDDRSLAALQINARSAASQLSTLPTTRIHIPFLFADPSNHHFDASLSRSVVEGLLQAHVQEHSQDLKDSLSRHFPLPVNVPQLFTSILTQLFEQGNLLPSSVDHILLVGGASRFPLFRQALKESLENILGPGGAVGKLILPESSLVTEITVIGASTMIPNYDYDMETGLQRV